ncbi:MAG: hypothetical protein HY840_14080 [Bacteroidetes bacterium]|nr:hypothetical protein [Bacteroidota bacterium]
MKIDTPKIKTLPTASIVEPQYKTKLENPLMYEHLKNSILHDGQTVLIDIRQNEQGQNELFRGRNIKRALSELCITTAIVYDHGNLSLSEAKLTALRIDAIQFPWDDVDLSTLLYDLSQQYPMEYLYNKIGLSKKKIDGLIELKTYDWEKETAEEQKKREIRGEKKRQKMLLQIQDKQRKEGIHLYKRIGLNLFQ